MESDDHDQLLQELRFIVGRGLYGRTVRLPALAQRAGVRWLPGRQSNIASRDEIGRWLQSQLDRAGHLRGSALASDSTRRALAHLLCVDPRTAHQPAKDRRSAAATELGLLTGGGLRRHREQQLIEAFRLSLDSETQEVGEGLLRPYRVVAISSTAHFSMRATMTSLRRAYLVEAIREISHVTVGQKHTDQRYVGRLATSCVAGGHVHNSTYLEDGMVTDTVALDQTLRPGESVEVVLETEIPDGVPTVPFLIFRSSEPADRIQVELSFSKDRCPAQLWRAIGSLTFTDAMSPVGNELVTPDGRGRAGGSFESMTPDAWYGFAWTW